MTARSSSAVRRLPRRTRLRLTVSSIRSLSWKSPTPRTPSIRVRRSWWILPVVWTSSCRVTATARRKHKQLSSCKESRRLQYRNNPSDGVINHRMGCFYVFSSVLSSSVLLCSPLLFSVLFCSSHLLTHLFLSSSLLCPYLWRLSVFEAPQYAVPNTQSPTRSKKHVVPNTQSSTRSNQQRSLQTASNSDSQPTVNRQSADSQPTVNRR